MRLIIAGGRDFENYRLLKSFILKNFDLDGLEIVSGGAHGADLLGERFAKEHFLRLHSFPADWNQYGKAAGAIRNAEMANFADKCVCFWDGQSKGTADMISKAKAAGMSVYVVNYKPKTSV